MTKISRSKVIAGESCLITGEKKCVESELCLGLKGRDREPLQGYLSF